MSTPSVAVIGAGWAGITTARVLADAGVRVEVFEKSDRVGGHSRTEQLEGVVYEPNGAHIFHTSDAEVARFVQRFGLVRPYEHVVLTEIYVGEDDEDGRLLSWPPQVSELADLPQWPSIERELDQLPDHPAGEDFETFVISMMGPTLYELFIREYTVKQWDRDPATLSSSFAPRRIELRTDGYRRLFRDRWEFFGPNGANDAMEAAASGLDVHLGVELTALDLDRLGADFDQVVITAALDRFLGRPGELEWRGVELRSRYEPTASTHGTSTPAYVVNRPSSRVPYTRTIETKHATGQEIAGTVVSEEYPGAQATHYPVATVDRRFERRNEELQMEVARRSPVAVRFCGRLANYTYINQDEAIKQGMATAEEIIEGP